MLGAKTKFLSAATATAAFFLLLPSATADVAPGFPLPGGSSNLTIVYNTNDTVSPPGELLPRPVTAQRPSISSPSSLSSTTTQSPPPDSSLYILFMIDIDVPRNNTRVPLLHWLAPNTSFPSSSSSSSSNTSSSLLLIPQTNPVPYLQPSPPVGDIPHAYTFILLRQPPGFAIPESYSGLAGNRVGFDVVKFVRDAGLGDGDGDEVVLASNWIRVQNTTMSTNATGTGFPPPRPSQTGGYQGPMSSGGSSSSSNARGGVLGGIGLVLGVLGAAAVLV